MAIEPLKCVSQKLNKVDLTHLKIVFLATDVRH